MEEDEFLDDDFGEASVLSDGGKKCTIYVIDASPRMFEKSVDSNDCAFRRALKVFLPLFIITQLYT